MRTPTEHKAPRHRRRVHAFRQRDEVDLEISKRHRAELAGLAEFERELTIERIRAGVDAYRERSDGAWGRRPRPVETDRLRALLIAKIPLRQIARELNIPRTTLRRAIQRAADE